MIRWTCLVILWAAILVDSTEGGAVCPGSGSCCESNHSPGCDDTVCCETVCAVDPYCCDGDWDEVCADEAYDLCDGGAYCMFCPGSGSCCEANGTPRCDDPDCCQAVCAIDRYCCDEDWDPGCAGEADQICGGAGVSYCGFCPGAGDCCQANGSPGCDDAACCFTVCADDPFCCGDQWDSTCAGIANNLCGGGGGWYCGVCPGTGLCCEPNGTPGCDDAACCQAVCSTDPLCCSAGWDAACTGIANNVCGGGGGGFCGFCPGTGLCCEPNGSPGCEDTACCDTVCSAYAFCCTTGWDADCAGAADSLCGSGGGGFCGFCPGTGSCCEANGTPGCDDAACCETVCVDYPSCCGGVWDAVCAGAADELCAGGGEGFCAVCPGAGSCCDANGTPGCDDTACCETVCATYPDCCTTGWDSSCVSAADALCGGGFCAVCPGAGSCCDANGTPGCDDTTCCETVCATYPDCCTTDWNAACAGEAQSQCPACQPPPIPTVSGWGLIAATLVLFAAGTIIITRSAGARAGLASHRGLQGRSR